MLTWPDKTLNIDQYISHFPNEIQQRLEVIRKIIKQAAPESTETISYMMPTFKLNGNLVHFAAYKKHIGFYPTPSGISKFKKELLVFKNAKGSVQFLHDKPLPIELIKKIVEYRVSESRNKYRTGVKIKL